MTRTIFFVIAIAACRDDANDKADAQNADAQPVVEEKRTPAGDAIHAYETAASCDARAQTIVNGAAHRAELGQACAARKVDRYETAECDNLGAAATQCHAVARRDGDKTRYWLVKQPNGQLLVDFLATERPVQLADLVEHLPSTPTVARISARLGTSYRKTFRGKKDVYLALRVRAPKGDRDVWAYAYAPRDSPAGATLASVIKSPVDYTDLTVALWFPTSDRDVILVDQVLATDFFETDAERAFGKDGGS